MNKFSFSIIFTISGNNKSIVSRANIVGLSDDFNASAMAIQVAEFLEKSPNRILKSEFFKALSRISDLAKEPDSVELAKTKFGSGGSLFFKLSGNIMLRSLIGKLCCKLSALLMIFEKLWELPPINEILPFFCSGIFQDNS